MVGSERFGEKHKILVRIVNDGGAGLMDDGQPYCVPWMMTLSGDPRSTLRKLRENLLGRKLTDEEAYDGFDTDELINRKVGYLVTHNQSGETTFANIDSCWPLKNGISTAAASAAPGGNGEKPDDLEVDFFRRLLDVAVDNSLVSAEQAQGLVKQISQKTAAELQDLTGRLKAKLTEKGIEIPAETPAAANGTFDADQDLPF